MRNGREAVSFFSLPRACYCAFKAHSCGEDPLTASVQARFPWKSTHLQFCPCPGSHLQVCALGANTCQCERSMSLQSKFGPTKQADQPRNSYAFLSERSGATPLLCAHLAALRCTTLRYVAGTLIHSRLESPSRAQRPATQMRASSALCAMRSSVRRSSPYTTEKAQSSG